MRPRIAVTGTAMETKYGTGTYIDKAYIDGVIHGGGIPVLLPLTDTKDIDDTWISQYDGLLLSGGEDVDSLSYQQNPHPKQGRISPDRDLLEFAIISYALNQKMPLLGICRGIQVLNVACGGTLYQDIYSQVPGVMKHSQNAPRSYGTHIIKINPSSRLFTIYNHQKQIPVNSYHHQAIDRLADGLKVTATTDDGIIEAVEGTGNHFILGVQWHPEGMWKDYPEQLQLFKAFVDACKGL